MSRIIGARIRDARKQQGLTLAQLGGKDLSRSFLSAVEHGRARISLRALAIVAERLQRPISHFLDDTDTLGTLPADREIIRCHLGTDHADEITIEITLSIHGRTSIQKGTASENGNALP